MPDVLVKCQHTLHSLGPITCIGGGKYVIMNLRVRVVTNCNSLSPNRLRTYVSLWNSMFNIHSSTFPTVYWIPAAIGSTPLHSRVKYPIEAIGFKKIRCGDESGGRKLVYTTKVKFGLIIQQNSQQCSEVLTQYAKVTKATATVYL